MLRELINRLKSLRKRAELLKDNDSLNKESPVSEEQKDTPNFTITIEEMNGFYKMEISDYLRPIDYERRIEEIDGTLISDKISSCIWWNSEYQRVQKGTIYIIESGNITLNILAYEDNIKIDIKEKLEDITEEKILLFNSKELDFRFTSFKHDKIGSTFYTKYYNHKGFLPQSLELSTSEAKENITWLFNELEKIEGISSIIDLTFLKSTIFAYLERKSLIKKT